MDAIKKKMQAMKLEKENALDKAEQLEQKLRDVEENKAKVSFVFLYVFYLLYKCRAEIKEQFIFCSFSF